jgi:hypothetical protein
MQNRHTVGLFFSMGLFMMVVSPGCPEQRRPARARPVSRELPSEMIIPVSYQEINCPIQVMMDDCEGDIISYDNAVPKQCEGTAESRDRHPVPPSRPTRHHPLL